VKPAVQLSESRLVTVFAVPVVVETGRHRDAGAQVGPPEARDLPFLRAVDGNP